MKKSPNIILLLLLAILFVVCSLQNSGERQTIEIPAETRVSTITRIPTHTFTPSVTVDPIHATFLAMKTQSAMYWDATLPAQGVICEEGFLIDRFQGFIGEPTDDWWIYSCIPENNDFSRRYSIIMRSDGSKSWRLFHNDFSWAKGEMAGFFPYRWSANEHSVYLVPATRSGCGFNARSFFIDDFVLYYFDLENGELFEVLPDYSGSYSFSLSPDDSYLAYSKSDLGNEVYIRDMYTGDETIIELGNDYSIAGIFTWTFDSKQLVFAAGLEGWENNQAGISLFLLDTPAMQVKVLLDNDTRLLIPNPSWEVEENWLQEKVLSLRLLDLQARTSRGGWSININTGHVFEAIATPISTSSP